MMTKEHKSAKKAEEERKKKKRERHLSDIRSVAKSPEGRRLLWEILEKSGLFQVNGHTNEIDMARMEGQRANGIEILNDIMYAKASLFGQMQQEHASEMKREQIEFENELKESDPLSLD